MQFVPSLPPPIVPGPPEEAEELNKLEAVKKVEGVLERPTSIPVPRRPRHVPAVGSEESTPPRELSKRRQAGVLPTERRVFCRRIKEEPFLAGLRSHTDRRRNAQRKDDPAEHVDVEA